MDLYEKNVRAITLKAEYAGKLLQPSKDVKYITGKYGDIFMSEAGMVGFDKHALAVIVTDQLTGDSAKDIALANRLYYGGAKSINGYTWHHLEDGKTMILIPTELHEAYRHTGGDSFLNHGLKHYLETGEWQNGID